MSPKNKEEFYITISPEQFERKGEDFLIGTVLHTGKEVMVSLLTSDELKDNGMRPINKGAYKRPEIEDMISGESETGIKAFKVFEKFKTLSDPAMKAMPNAKVPDNLIVKVNTSIEVNDGHIASRWIDVLTGEGMTMLEMDNDKAISANGISDTGLYMQISRPSKFKDPANMFVEVVDANSSITSSPSEFSKDLIDGVDKSMSMKEMGGMPLTHVMCIDKNNKPVSFDFSYKSNGETKSYKSNQFTVRGSYNDNGKWKYLNSGKEAVAYALKTDSGKAVDNYLLENPDTKIVILPAVQFMMGPNVRNKIINDSKNNQKLTDLRFKPFEIDLGGQYPIRSFNKGQLSVRQGSKNKKSFYVTDVTTTDPFNKPISILDIAKYKLGITSVLKDNLKTEKPEDNSDKENAVTKNPPVEKKTPRKPSF